MKSNNFTWYTVTLVLAYAAAALYVACVILSGTPTMIDPANPRPSPEVCQQQALIQQIPILAIGWVLHLIVYIFHIRKGWRSLKKDIVLDLSVFAGVLLVFFGLANLQLWLWGAFAAEFIGLILLRSILYMVFKRKS